MSNTTTAITLALTFLLSWSADCQAQAHDVTDGQCDVHSALIIEDDVTYEAFYFVCTGDYQAPEGTVAVCGRDDGDVWTHPSNVRDILPVCR